MDFKGKICPYCKTEFKEGDDIVVCSMCEMPHHKECWIENKACTTFGCTGTIVGAEQYIDATENKRFCSKCGAAIGEGQKFCASCGTPASASGEPHFTVAGAPSVNQSYPQIPFTQPQYAPNTAYNYNSAYNQYGQEASEQDLIVFIQNNAPFYIESFRKMQVNNSKSSWNWSSFLFGSSWFAYRKMYGIAAAYAGISLIFSLIPGLGSVMGLAMSICSGIFGNYFYKQYVDTEMQNSSRFDEFNKNMYYVKKGGTNIGAALALFAAVYILALIIVFAQ